MTVSEEEYVIKCRRSLATIKKSAQLPFTPNPHERFGCLYPPLFDINPDHIIDDELHMLLRISGRLIDSLVVRGAELDHCTIS